MSHMIMFQRNEHVQKVIEYEGWGVWITGTLGV